MSRYLTINGIEVKGVDDGQELYCEFEVQGNRHRTKPFERVWKSSVPIGKYSRSESMDVRCKTKTDRARLTLAEVSVSMGEFSREGEYTREVSFEQGVIVLKVCVEKKRKKASSKVKRAKSEMIHKAKGVKAEHKASGTDVRLPPPVPARATTKRLKTPRASKTPRGNKAKTPRGGSTIVLSPRSSMRLDGPTTVELQPLAQSQSQGMKLFGVELDVLMKEQKLAHPDLKTPVFIHLAGKLIEAQGTNLKGIFRIRGKLRDVKAMRSKLDAGDLSALEDTQQTNIHTVCALVKAFMRELPVPVLTFETYDKFIACADLQGDEQLEALKDIVHSLPENNFQLLKLVVGLMNYLSKKPEETQMDAENLAKIITPNLFWKETVEIMDLSLVQDAMKGNSVGLRMIESYDEIFSK